MNSLFDHMEHTFARVYKSKLGIRAPTTWMMIKYLMKRFEENNNILIIETGTARQPDNWTGDGQSTIIWDWVASQLNGKVISIDISEDAIAAAKSQVSEQNVVFMKGNSIKVLDDSFYTLSADLLYLDSFDFNPKSSFQSSFHHLLELTACWASLPSECMVVVDDCISKDSGKHMLVSQFMDNLEIKPAFQGYQTSWIKP